MTYVLLTKFRNEEKNIPVFVEGVSRQTLRPKTWLILDDGSTDCSCSVFEKEAIGRGFTAIAVRGPRKARPNLDTVGRVYQLAFQKYYWLLDRYMRPDYLAMLDVDSFPPPDYFAILINALQHYPKIGCIAGQMKDDRRREAMPMGSGKVTRWSVVTKTTYDGFWDIDADTLLNIKAVAMGLWLVIVDDLFISGEKSFLWSKAGRRRLGGRMYYVGRPSPLVLTKSLRMALERDNGLTYLLGYLSEAIRHNWRCHDRDVERFYRSMNSIFPFQFLKIIRRHQID